MLLRYSENNEFAALVGPGFNFDSVSQSKPQL